MSGALEVAAIGMRVQQRALETIADNVSNINTPAFKRSEFRFTELVTRGDGAGGATPAGRNDGIAGVGFWSRPAVERQGQIDPTGNPGDIAVDGAGFLELMGPAGRTLLWRGGRLRVLQDGLLANAAGLPLKAGITVPVEATGIRIDRDGKVHALLPDPEEETQIGEIALVRVADEDAIRRLDGGIYAVEEGETLMETMPGEDGAGHLVQAALERSNVDLNGEMVGLLVAQRAYAANAQIVRAADELLGLANGLRR